MVFACSEREIDSRILSKQVIAGKSVDFRPNPGRPFGVRPRTLVRFVWNWGGAVRHGRALIQELRAASGRSPVVVAMGGFVAAPVVQAARAERCPVLMMNLDAVPGRANRWIAGRADSILTTAIVPGSPWKRIPPLVRSAARWEGSAEEARVRLGLEPKRQTLFVTGASQGARSINQFVIELVRTEPSLFANWQIVHQTGPSETAEARAAYAQAGIPHLVEPFFDVMGPCWGAADVAIARAGAGSVAEAWAGRVPAVFLPYPYHADQHQRANAAELVASGGAVVADDLIEADRNLKGEAGKATRRLLVDAGERAVFRKGLEGLGEVDGARRVAAEIVRLGGSRK